MEERRILYFKNYFMNFYNGFLKKTKKTPKNEIEKAKRIKKEYYESKE
jgi:phage-related protein